MSQQINLFDAALQAQHDPWSAKNIGGMLLVLLVLGALWGGWAHWTKAQQSQTLAQLSPQVERVQSEVKQLTEQLANLKPDNQLIQDLNDAKSRLAARGEVLQILKKGLAPEATSQADWLRGFARQIPNGIWLTGFSINTDTNALDIKGRTTDPALIPEYMRRLSAEKAFQGRTFAALEIAKNAPETLTPGTTAPPAVALLGAVVPGSLPATPAVPTPAPAKPVANFHEFELTSGLPGANASASGSKP